MRPCAAKGCDVIGLQEIKRNRPSELAASGYRVYFSSDCSGAKGRKEQHGVGLTIKEGIAKKAGKDRIAMDYISARPLKARTLIKSNFVTSVVAYTSTEEAPEEHKAEYMAALNTP